MYFMKSFKIHHSLLLVCLSLLLFTACTGNKNKTEEATEESVMITTAKDTASVQSQCDQYMELLKNQKIDEALDMLYYIDSLQYIIPLPEAQRNNVKRLLNIFPVISYKFDGVIFNSDMDNQVRYTIEFFKKEPGDDRPNTTAIYLKPIRKDDKWYITVYDTGSDHGPASKIK